MLCFSFFGFNIGKEPVVENEKAEYLPYQIYVKNNREKAPLEQNKCMSGAYIYDENIYSDIKSFEEKLGINNDIYISTMKAGDDLPIGEIIECYAKGKLPMLIIEGSFGSSQIMSIAKMCGNLDISLLIEIKEGKYVYEHFAEMFRKYAPKTVLAYGIESSSVNYDFPGKELVDWIAIDVKEIMRGRDIASEYENISKWCNYFKDETLMLNISVPNFSIDGCNYIYSEAANEISKLYTLAVNYNNIGAINYISHIEKNENTISCNYRITENEQLENALNKAVNSLVSDRYWSRTPYIAYAAGNSVIAANDVVDRLNIKGKYINSGYSEINAGGFNKSERKVFVNS